MRKLALIALLVPARAAADPVTVKVTEVAGGLAYVDEGEATGLHPGGAVHLGDRWDVIVQVTARTAAIRYDGAAPAIGAEGTVEVTPRASFAPAARAATPRPLDVYRAQWPTAAPPAGAQHPKLVSLGRFGGGGRSPWRAMFRLSGAAFSKGDGHLGLDAAVSYAPYRERALGGDLDLSARLYPRYHDARVPVFVRAADLRYGELAAIGRLRWASSSTGLLDGARVATHVGSLELAGFGGIVPDPIDGTPDPSASRFGVEAAWRRGDSHASAEILGSTWKGALDQRRITVAADTAVARVGFDGFAEVSQLDTTALSGAGLGAAWRSAHAHARVDLAYDTPERSKRLDALLPTDWLAEPTYTAVAGAGLERGAWTLDAGASLGRPTDAAGFAIAGHDRWELGVSGGRTSFTDWGAAIVGLTSAHRRLTWSLHLRPELVDERGSLGSVFATAASADLRWTWRPQVILAGSLDGAYGGGQNAAAALASITWRPR